MRKFLPLIFLLFFPLFCFSQSLDSIFYLHEVEVSTNYNPAIRIVKNTIDNKKQNSIYNRTNFKCDVFHSLLFTTQLSQDSLFNARCDSVLLKMKNNLLLSHEDSNLLSVHNFVSRYHLFLMETVTEKMFKKPNRESQRIIAHHTAGMKDPFLALYATQIQTFSIYKYDFIEVMEKKFVSPISSEAINKYSYRLLAKEIIGNDTLFTISFCPQKNTHFMSLQGVMVINSDGYAVQELKFTPFDKSLDMPFEVEHRYIREKNGAWFPEKITYVLHFSNLNFLIKDAEILVISTQLISNMITDIEIQSKDLGFTDIAIKDNSSSNQHLIIDKFRNRALDSVELNTFKMWDTIGKITKLDKRIFFLKTLATGRLAVGPIDINLEDIIHFNHYEKVRLGLGLKTNHKMSKYFSMGGFWGYGLKDKDWKWGGECSVKFIRSRDFMLSLAFSSDVTESAEILFYDRDYTMLSGEFYRSWLIGNFDKRKSLECTLQGKPMRFLTCYVSAQYSQNQTCFAYNYLHPLEKSSPFFSYDNFWIKAAIRLGFKEERMDDECFIFHKVSPYPIVSFQYIRGIDNIFKSSFSYNRFDLKCYHLQNYRILGFSEFYLSAGFIDRDLPYSLLYTPHAGLEEGLPFGFDGKEQFAVMKPHEFICDRYFMLFFRHNFGRMTQNRNFSPRIVFAQHVGLGSLQHPENHYGVDLKTMNKGYFETGLIVEDLLVIYKLLSFGVGAYYRYGAYRCEKEIDNWAFKIRFRVSISR